MEARTASARLAAALVSGCAEARRSLPARFSVFKRRLGYVGAQPDPEAVERRGFAPERLLKTIRDQLL